MIDQAKSWRENERPNAEIFAGIMSGTSSRQRQLLMLRMALRCLSYSLLEDLGHSVEPKKNMPHSERNVVGVSAQQNSLPVFKCLPSLIKIFGAVYHETDQRVLTPFKLTNQGTVASDLTIKGFKFQMRLRPNDDSILELIFWPHASGQSHIEYAYLRGSMFALLAEMQLDAESEWFSRVDADTCPALFSNLASKAMIPSDLLGLISESERWAFWREWYQGFLDGKPMDWELQRRVALIDGAIWEAGPEAVAEEIERIRAEFLAEKTPQAERVEFNPGTAKFYTVPIEIAKPDLLGATLSQVSDALEDVLASPSNGLHDNAREVRVLRRVFTKYGNDPQQIEMSFVSVHRGLTRQILDDELPPSEENLALQSAVEEGARAIRATHEDIAENRKILNEQVIRELPEGAKKTLEDALPMLVAISEAGLAEEWQHDIPQLINDATLPLPTGAPPLPGADEATRIFSRVAKIALHLKAAEVVHRIDGSAGYKAARIITTVAALVALGIAIL